MFDHSRRTLTIASLATLATFLDTTVLYVAFPDISATFADTSALLRLYFPDEEDGGEDAGGVAVQIELARAAGDLGALGQGGLGGGFRFRRVAAGGGDAGTVAQPATFTERANALQTEVFTVAENRAWRAPPGRRPTARRRRSAPPRPPTRPRRPAPAHREPPAMQLGQIESLFDRALAIREKALGSDHPDVAATMNGLGVMHLVRDQYAQAEQLFQRSLAIREKALGAHHPDVAASLANLAALYRIRGQYEQAEPLYRRSIAIREKALGMENPDLAISLNGLAMLYDARRQYTQAEPLFKRALAIREKTLGPRHPDVAASLTNLAKLYRTTNRVNEAEELSRRAGSI